jgi:hypothetical protein
MSTKRSAKRDAGALPIRNLDLSFLRDDVWAVEIFVGLEVPPIANLRLALRSLAEAQPSHRLLCHFDALAELWRPAVAPDWDRYIEEIVVDLGELESRPTSMIAEELLSHHSNSLAFQLLVGQRTICVSATHAVGDAHYLTTVVESLLRSAWMRDAPTDLLMPPLRYAGVVAAGRYVISQPSATAKRASTAVGRLPSRLRNAGRRRSSDVAVPQDVIVLASRSDWRFGVSSADVSADVLALVQRWRAEQTADSSLASLWFSATVGALEAAGFRSSRSGPIVIVDCRRYAGHRRHIVGNFVASVEIPRIEASTPESLHIYLQRALHEGQPLAELAVSYLRVRPFASRLVRQSAGVQTRHSEIGRHLSMNDPRAVAVSLSWIGSIERSWSIPWTGQDSHLMPAATTASPAELTVFYTEVRGALNVTVVFETSIVDRVRVTEALRLLATDPLGFFPGPPALAPG